jgi:acyl-CoA synthetase (AMP-forming)/AMP-acid ligase II
MTAAELLARARAAAARFLAAGVEHVALVDVNTEAVPIALFGAGLAGLPFAPVNYRLTDDQLHGILRRLTPGLVIAGPDEADRIGDVEGLQVMTRDELLAIEPDGADLPFVDPDEIAVLLFTSGTTGEPKAAVLRHRHLTSYILTSVEYLSAGEDEAQLVSVPPYHVAGISAVLSSLYSGRRIAYLPAFDPDAWVATVRDQGVTQAMVVPTMLGRVLDVAADGDLRTLRHLSYGGGRMPVELIERAMAALPDVSFVNAYGLTETSSTISVLTPEDHRDHAKLGSVGRPLPTLELEVRDAEGDVCGPGEVGEIHVRGEQVAGEYLGRSVLTDDGWFPTNDLGHLDEDGFLYLDGRMDDVIVRGAENLSPGEIEETLMAHPAVVDACVVGVPDSEWGEAVAAAVVLAAEASDDELKDWVRERLRSTRTPEVIHVRDELPYNETGKLLRRVVRDELKAAR